MIWTNYHTHCLFCDGDSKPRDYAQAAIDNGLEALGFSSHAPLPFPTRWNIPIEKMEEYCRVVRALGREFDGRLRVHLSLEVDYIPDINAPRDPALDQWNLDYVIGSVHFVDRFADGERWGIDTNVPLFERGLNEVFDGDIRLVVERYYHLIRRMLRESTPDILGHIDVIKKFNIADRYFSESAPWYRDQILETLQTVADSGVILEINTGHLARGRFDTPYPSSWILERVLALDIPIMLNADAHSPRFVAGEFPAVANDLAQIGFRRLMFLDKNGQWSPRAFTKDGLETRKQ